MFAWYANKCLPTDFVQFGDNTSVMKFQVSKQLLALKLTLCMYIDKSIPDTYILLVKLAKQSNSNVTTVHKENTT
jgi:hypothetical protein